MATMKPDPNEIINPRRRIARQEQEAGLDSPAPTVVDQSTKKTEMSQADFSGYKGGRAARPSEAELESRIAAKKKGR